MVTTVKLFNTSITSHSYQFVCVVEPFKIFSTGDFQMHNTVLLTTVTMLSITSPKLLHLITRNLVALIFFTHFPQLSPHTPDNHQSVLWVWLFRLHTLNEITQHLSLSEISLTISPQVSSMFLQMAGFPLFLWMNNTPLYICTTFLYPFING